MLLFLTEGKRTLQEHLSGTFHRWTGSLVTGGLMKGEEIRILSDCCPRAKTWRGLTQGCVEDVTTQAQGPLVEPLLVKTVLLNFIKLKERGGGTS